MTGSHVRTTGVIRAYDTVTFNASCIVYRSISYTNINKAKASTHLLAAADVVSSRALAVFISGNCVCFSLLVFSSDGRSLVSVAAIEF